jgi:5-methylcytosine-specific restriction endonuclease McrA
MADTLVLNADAKPYSILPLSTITWQESIKYFVLDKVTVLEWYDDWVVSSPNWETRVPAVVMIKKYIRKNSSVRFTKFNLMLRDAYTCQYCDANLTRSQCTLDHVLPISKGGKTTWTNVVTACGPCNVAKGDKLFPKPNRIPMRPTYYDLIRNHEYLNHNIKHKSWETFIFG